MTVSCSLPNDPNECKNILQVGHQTKLISLTCANALQITAHMCVGPTKGTYRRDIKMIVNHDYIKQCIIFAKFFFS